MCLVWKASNVHLMYCAEDEVYIDKARARFHKRCSVDSVRRGTHRCIHNPPGEWGRRVVQSMVVARLGGGGGDSDHQRTCTRNWKVMG